MPVDWKPSWIRPKVVMMAGNDIVVDARVLKYAQTVANWDLDVTCIGIPGRRFRGVPPLRQGAGVVPAHPVEGAADGVAQAAREPQDQPRPWFSTEAEYMLAYGRWQYASRELRGDRGRDRRDHERIGGESGGARRSFSIGCSGRCAGGRCGCTARSCTPARTSFRRARTR